MEERKPRVIFEPMEPKRVSFSSILDTERALATGGLRDTVEKHDRLTAAGIEVIERYPGEVSRVRELLALTDRVLEMLAAEGLTNHEVDLICSELTSEATVIRDQQAFAYSTLQGKNQKHQGNR